MKTPLQTAILTLAALGGDAVYDNYLNKTIKKYDVEEKNCIYCGKPFKKKNKCFCSAECNNAYKNK